MIIIVYTDSLSFVFSLQSYYSLQCTCTTVSMIEQQPSPHTSNNNSFFHHIINGIVLWRNHCLSHNHWWMCGWWWWWQSAYCNVKGEEWYAWLCLWWCLWVQFMFVCCVFLHASFHQIWKLVLFLHLMMVLVSCPCPDDAGAWWTSACVPSLGLCLSWLGSSELTGLKTLLDDEEHCWRIQWVRQTIPSLSLPWKRTLLLLSL